MCLQGYDCTISYCQGKEKLLADTLSTYAPAAAEEITLDTVIQHVHIGTSCKTPYQELTHKEPLLCTLAETIIASWPEDSKDVPHDLWDYWNHHDIMTVEDGIMLHGEAILIPTVEREEVLCQIHERHQGITKCQLYT